MDTTIPRSRIESTSAPRWGEYKSLSPREYEVLQGLTLGLLYKEIAEKLGVSYSAVHKCQHQLFKKLHVSNRSEAILAWHLGKVNGAERARNEKLEVESTYD